MAMGPATAATAAMVSNKRFMSEKQRPEIRRMESVDVLFRIHALEHGVFVDMLWQRKLNENPIDGVVFIQFSHLIHQFRGLDGPR